MTSLRTVLEIYFNPDDLEIVVSEVKDQEGFYGGYIGRGPRNDHHPFNILLSTPEPTKDRDFIIESFGKVLLAAIEHGDKVFTEGSVFKSLFTNGFETREDYVKKSAPVLEKEDVDKMLSEIKEKGVCSTYLPEWNWKDRYPEKVLA